MTEEDLMLAIETVSPGMAEDSSEQFGRFNPGRLPVPMNAIGSAFARSVGGCDVYLR